VIVKGLGGGSRKADEGAVAQTGQAFAGFVGNGTRRGCDQALAKKGLCFEFGVSHRQAHDADVDSSVEKSGDLRRRGHVAHLQLDQGVASAKTKNRARENGGNRGDAEADAESAGATLHGSSGGIEGHLRLAGQLLGNRNEQAARFGERNLAASASEERAAEFRLETLDLLAEGRLGDEQALCGFAEMQLLGEDKERPQFLVLQIHNCRLSQRGYTFIGRNTPDLPRIKIGGVKMRSRNHDGSGSRQIQAAVLDFGEVLCLRPEPEAMGRMARLLGIAPEGFLERYIPTRGPYDQGLMTPKEYWMDFARGSGVSIDGDVVEKLRRMDTAMWSRINVEMADWVEKLHGAGLTTALLSNMQEDMASYARKNFDWLRHFDHQILSCELRLIKPDPEIFRRAIERLGVKPQATLFVDDREANVEAARALGVRAIQFKSTEQLRAELREMGFKVLPRK
jgi:putative hydrolase of the HAD superfamily